MYCRPARSIRAVLTVALLALCSLPQSRFVSAWTTPPLSSHTTSTFHRLPSISTFLFSSPSTTEVGAPVQEKVRQVLSLARSLGPVGSLCSQDDQERILQAEQALPPVVPAPATTIELQGIHKLVYSAAPGGSSGKLGPFVGSVTQQFVNATHFINAVDFAGGALRIALTASRKVLDDGDRINVFFHKTTVYLFGKKLVEKEVSGGGQWQYIWAGVIKDKEANNKKKLVRIMETPSLFVLEQDLE